ncbi:MAG TPA: DNA polymerase III subunit gamma/tau [Terriglobales bacterium]|nr:DNA polymerase III subunit gamma/tau [Terriglobales bacterium]
MSYEIFARKYRPKTFEEVIGQRSVVQTIQNAITSGRIAQAYLFSGVRGTGKTTVARILAKALNCVDGPTPHPCNKCEYCTAINEDRAIDVLEIDGASNRSIEDIKALREALKYRAIYTRYKVIIIDEVHQISRDGFNALLKTLEEPPPNTVFIFATTEFNKVPPTIVSRCQHFEFRKISHKDIINHLMEITRKEGITVTPAGLALIAGAAEGSMRDAQSLLDQAVAFSGENVGDDDVKTILGTIGQDILFRFSTAVLDERPQDIFPLVDGLISSGTDLRFFFGRLIGHFRDLLVVSSVERPEDYLFVTAEELEALRALVAKGTAEDFLRYVVALQQGEQGLRYATQPRIYVETFLIRLCQFRKIVPLKELLQDVESLARTGGSSPRTGEPRPGPVPGRSTSSRTPQPQDRGVRPAEAAVPGSAHAQGSATAGGPATGAKAAVPSPDKATFGRVLERLTRDRAPLAALLGQATSVRIRDGLIEVFFERGKGFFGTTIQEKDVKAVEAAAREVLGREMTVQFAEEGGAALEPGRPAPGREMDSALKDPTVQYFMNTFKAQILSADPVKPAKEKEPKGFGPGEGGA